MSGWNYRVGKRSYKVADNTTEDTYGIYEVYYNDDGTIFASSENAMAAFGDTEEELKECLRMMQLAFKKEIIDLDTITYTSYDIEEKIDADNDYNEID